MQERKEISKQKMYYNTSSWSTSGFYQSSFLFRHQKDVVKFEPQLPSWKMDSIKKMGMGLMNKVILQFDSCFWTKSLYSICYASENRGEFRWFYNQLPSTDSPVLIGFLTAELARKMEELSDEEIVSKALKVLSTMYPGKMTKLVKSFVTRYHFRFVE